jgi:uncharacterized membrane protein
LSAGEAKTLKQSNDIRNCSKYHHFKLDLIQWAPLNGITLGLGQTDSINQMIPLTDMHFSIISNQAMEIFEKMIPLTE